MYIEPNTVVRLLNNIRLNNRYTDTINFTDISSQINYFSGKTKHTLDRNTYQRVNAGVFRCGLSADSCYDCTYMMFQNTNYGNKWFYAFINKVEYINNDMCNIYFEIDVMQTYWFDFTFNQCLVEREHVIDDTIGANTYPENIEYGEYIINSENFINMSDSKGMYVEALTTGLPTETTTDWEVRGGTYGGVYCGLYSWSGIRASDFGAINTFIQGYARAGKSDAIITLHQYPAFLENANKQNHWIAERNDTIEMNTVLGHSMLGGLYEPKNNKLYCYPYNLLVGTNLMGETKEYKFEDFTGTVTFKTIGVRVPSCEIICYPVGYRGITNDYDDGLNMNNFPVCAWSNDYFQNWLTQNQYRLSSSLTTNAISSISNIIGASANAGIMNFNTGNTSRGSIMGVGNATLNAMTSTVNTLESTLAQMSTAATMPNGVAGSISRGTLQCATPNKYQFVFYQMTCKAEYLKKIDDYFELYGYKVNTVKDINYSSRPYWNFVKTVGCTITSSLPVDDSSKICDIMDNGIRFWKNGDNIGEYLSLNNH